MITINKNIQSEILMTTMEEIVPEDSLFRKIDKYIDFTFIYDKVKDLYCDNNGRPSIDPVVLFKIVFIQALDGLKSMRQTCKKIKVDAEYRWFLGIPFGENTKAEYQTQMTSADLIVVWLFLEAFLPEISLGGSRYSPFLSDNPYDQRSLYPVERKTIRRPDQYAFYPVRHLHPPKRFHRDFR